MHNPLSFEITGEASQLYTACVRIYGAEGGIRTHTGLSPRRPERRTSTNSITSAPEFSAQANISNRL